METPKIAGAPCFGQKGQPFAGHRFSNKLNNSTLLRNETQYLAVFAFIFAVKR